jgi:hypothetical protein
VWIKQNTAVRHLGKVGGQKLHTLKYACANPSWVQTADPAIGARRLSESAAYRQQLLDPWWAALRLSFEINPAQNSKREEFFNMLNTEVTCRYGYV